MDPSLATIAPHLLTAVLAGTLIGFERSYHGRPAGFRTHTLVCLASSLLMLVPVYQQQWFPGGMADTVRLDPTRMAQGVMTGIGFLGAGVIIKEGASVRGLTTAASIWITAAIGILAGVGLYGGVAVSTLLTLGVLTAFRWIERKMPIFVYANHFVRFDREHVMPEAELRELIEQHRFTIANMSYHLVRQGCCFEYRMTVRTLDRRNLQRLTQTLANLPSVVEFRITPSGD